jgi:hypothetical protein
MLHCLEIIYSYKNIKFPLILLQLQ